MSGAHSPTLVAVHLPKTAGTSLRIALEAAYGDGLATDYADHPLQHGVLARRGRALAHSLRWAGRRLPHACIYGHFLPLKYALARDTFFSIWLRDPVQRIISRYHHYVRASAAGETVHARRGLVPGLTLEQFVRLPHFQNTLSEYLWGFPVERFGFVGRVEHWASDASRMFAALDLPPPQTVAENTNPARTGDAYAPSAEERALIERLNARDVRLHERLLAHSSRR